MLVQRISCRSVTRVTPAASNGRYLMYRCGISIVRIRLKHPSDKWQCTGLPFVNSLECWLLFPFCVKCVFYLNFNYCHPSFYRLHVICVSYMLNLSVSNRCSKTRLFQIAFNISHMFFSTILGTNNLINKRLLGKALPTIWRSNVQLTIWSRDLLDAGENVRL